MNNAYTTVRLYNDAQGESHFEDITNKGMETNFAPPAAPVFVTMPTEAKRHLFLILPGNWYGEPHPVPNRQIMTVLNGELEVRVSDGSIRVFRTGDTALVEDTEGRGHSTKNLTAKPLALSVTQL